MNGAARCCSKIVPMCADPGEHGYGLSKLNTEARYNRSTQNNCFELFPRAWHFSRSAFSPCTHSAAEATTFGLCRWTPLTSFLRTCTAQMSQPSTRTSRRSPKAVCRPPTTAAHMCSNLFDRQPGHHQGVLQCTQTFVGPGERSDAQNPNRLAKVLHLANHQDPICTSRLKAEMKFIIAVRL